MKINKCLIWFFALFALFILMVTVIPKETTEYPSNNTSNMENVIPQMNATLENSDNQLPVIPKEVTEYPSNNTSNMKNVILQMTATLENSDTQLQFNYAENLGDERGITFGCIGFCTGTYDGNILIEHYTELNPDNALAKYIPVLDKIDAGPHDAADGDGNPRVEGLSGFIQDVNSCDDPLFKKAQMDKLDEFYYNPAMEIADSIGAKNSLTKAFIYDMCVRHGVDQTEDIINNAGTTPKQGADENTYLRKLILLRNAKLKQEGIEDVDRNQGYKNLLNSGNVDLKTPFKFVAYGDTFTIDGKLELGEYQQ